MELLRRTIGTHHDLLARLEERIKCVEEFLLRALLAREELDIIHDEHVDLPVAPPKRIHLPRLKRFDHLIRKFLRGGIEHGRLWIRLEEGVSYRLKQVGFPKSYAAVDEEGVVFPP